MDEVKEVSATESTATETAPKKKASKKKSSAKKATPKASSKKASPKKSGTIGVIGTIFELTAREEGATAPEIIKELTKRFKDRDAEGMETTTRIQVNRLPKRYGFEMKKKTEEGRGLVYKAPKGAFNDFVKSKNISDASKAA